MQNVGCCCCFFPVCSFLLPFVCHSEWHMRWTSRYCTFNVNLICLCLARARFESEHTTPASVFGNCCNCRQSSERGWAKQQQQKISKQTAVRLPLTPQQLSNNIAATWFIWNCISRGGRLSTWSVDRSVDVVVIIVFRVIDFKIWNSLHATQSSGTYTTA